MTWLKCWEGSTRDLRECRTCLNRFTACAPSFRKAYPRGRAVRHSSGKIAWSRYVWARKVGDTWQLCAKKDEGAHEVIETTLVVHKPRRVDVEGGYQRLT